jgi:molybdate transport system substrate-binding protein
MMRSVFAVMAMSLSLAAAITPARADYPVAPDVVVFCEPTLRHAVTDLGTLWRKETGVPVRVFTSPTWALLEQISHRARSDLVIGEGDAAAATATERHLVWPETIQTLWRNQLVVAAMVNIASSSSAPHLAELAGKAPIAVLDPWTTVAGAEGRKALEALGLWDPVSAKSMGVVDTADASYLLATGKVQLALLYATDVAADPSLAIADRFPSASYGPIVYWIAETHHALSPNVERFAAFLRQPRAQERLRADGLEVQP